ncbi:MAG: hypothetical protein IT294_06155 [Deltaproteobacteria bacterium]|nr:hypothetical protein [Deltaproteobacteria bacterium]
MSALVYLAGLVVIASVAAAIAWPLLRPVVASAPAPVGDPERYRWEKEKDLAYAAIKEADFDLQMGKLSLEDHAAIRDTYEARALAALAALERFG